jgi:putative peptidoglycan lipid II flippase
MIRGILTIGGWTMGSRILGFVRDILIAALLGAGPVADAFFVANRLPNLFRRLFGEGAFNAAFVPSFAGLLATEGPEAAQAFAGQAASVLAFWLVSLTVLAEIFMPQVMSVLAPGFLATPGKFRLAVTLSRITFPYMPLICVAALLSGVLNGMNRFAAAAAAPMLYNLTSIGFMLGLLHVLPTAGHALAWGVSASGVFQLALLVWAVRRTGMRLHLPRPRLNPAMRRLLRRMGPGLLGAGVTQLNLSVDVIIGSLLPPGTVSVLYYADRVNQLPLGTIGAAVGTALLPTLSREVLSDRPEQALATMNRALDYALLLTVPATLALLVCAHPIIAVLFQRGAFSPHDVRLSAQALQAYAVGLPAFVVVKALVSGFFARGDTGTPVKVGIFCVVLNLCLNLLFMVPLKHLGPPLASALSAWVNVAGLTLLLSRRGQFAVDAGLRRLAPRIGAAGLAMAAVLWLVEWALRPEFARPGARWIALAMLVGSGFAAYGLAAQAVGALDARASLRSLRTRLTRRRSAAGRATPTVS